MTALTNPFDVLPANLFNVLGTQGGYQRHYMAILLQIYEEAEFNRFGLTRERVIAIIMDYLSGDGAEVMARPELIDLADDESAPPNNEREYASWFLRRLIEASWVEVEHQADYTDLVILPDYAFTLLEAFRAIQQQKPREYTGQLYTAHQLLTNQSDDFAPSLALTQAYENIRQLIRGLNELNQNIGRYTQRVTRDKSVPQLLRMQFDEYALALGPAYHTLKTSDHISRYRRDIVSQLQTWQIDGEWIEGTANELATQSRLTPAQASNEIGRILDFIIYQLESLDPLLLEIDRRHAQYLRTSLRQIRYQLVSAEGGFKDRLASLAQRLAALQSEGESDQPEEMPAFHTVSLPQPDANSFYTPPKRHAPFVPERIAAPVLGREEARRLRDATLQELGQALTPARIEQFVGQFLNGHASIHARDLPPEAFADDEDLPWLIYAIAYGNHPEVNYDLEAVPGEPVQLGSVRVKPFVLAKRR